VEFTFESLFFEVIENLKLARKQFFFTSRPIFEFQACILRNPLVQLVGRDDQLSSLGYTTCQAFEFLLLAQFPVFNKSLSGVVQIVHVLLTEGFLAISLSCLVNLVGRGLGPLCCLRHCQIELVRYAQSVALAHRNRVSVGQWNLPWVT
jgi:hypothetical protein